MRNIEHVYLKMLPIAKIISTTYGIYYGNDVAFKTYNPKDTIKEKQNIMNMNHSSTYLHQKANEDQKFWKQFV